MQRIAIGIFCVVIAQAVSFAETPPVIKVTQDTKPVKELDDKQIPFPDREKAYARNVKDFTKVQNERNSKDEYDAYNSLLRHANQFTVKQLIKNSRTDVKHDVELFKKEDGALDKFRCEVFQFTGFLRSLKKFDANDDLKEAGIKTLYEAWIFPRKSANPIVVVLMEKPEGIEVADELREAQLVTVAGYFFKTLVYQTREEIMRPAPMFMSRGLIVVNVK